MSTKESAENLWDLAMKLEETLNSFGGQLERDEQFPDAYYEKYPKVFQSLKDRLDILMKFLEEDFEII